MPDLEITAGGLKDRAALFYVEALMLAPDDEGVRDRIRRRSALMGAIGNLHASGVDTVSRDDAVTLALTALEVGGALDVERRLWFGTTAGRVLGELIISAEAGEPRSISEIIKRQSKDLSSWRRDSAPKKGTGISVALFNAKIWPKWKPVAHLWAAREWLIVQRGPTGAFPCQLRDLGALLAMGEIFRKRGEAMALHQSRHGPALDGAKMWRLPAELHWLTDMFDIEVRQPAE